MCLHSDRKPPGSQAGAFVRLSVRVGGCGERPEAALRISHEGYPSLFQGSPYSRQAGPPGDLVAELSYPLTVAGTTSARRAVPPDSTRGDLGGAAEPQA